MDTCQEAAAQGRLLPQLTGHQVQGCYSPLPPNHIPRTAPWTQLCAPHTEHLQTQQPLCPHGHVTGPMQLTHLLGFSSP